MFYKFRPVKLWARLRYHLPSDVLRGILQKVFSFEGMIVAMPDSGMIQDLAKIVNEAIKDEVQVNLSIYSRASGNASLIARKIAGRFNLENKQRPL
jgi:hypothetical protein